MDDTIHFTSESEYNKQLLVTFFSNQSDFGQRDLYMTELDMSCTLFFLKSRTDFTTLMQFMQKIERLTPSLFQDFSQKDVVVKSLETFSYQSSYLLSDTVDFIFEGKAILLLENHAEVFILDTARNIKRSIEDSSSEKVIRGPKLSFIESIIDNVGIVRQLTRDQNIIVKDHHINVQNNDKLIQYLYNQKQVSDELLKEIEKRLSSINTSNLEDSGMLEELIEDNPMSPFPQIQNTERPDRVIAAINEGRVAMFIDGSPFALIMPTTFDMLLQSPDDYYERWLAGSFLRVLRYLSIFITLFLSAFYISMVSFSQGLLPTELAITIASTRQNVPFPPFIEAIIMEITIELLREAGIRLPTPLGQTIGLVGGVIIGQAAVEANLVSSLMVIIIALTTITSFTVPQYSFGLSFRMLRFGAMISAAIFGLFGTVCFFIWVSIHLSNLKSFGTSYFSLQFSFSRKKFLDLFIRLPKRVKSAQ
ncbi:spore germination protein [Alkalicoccobacillus murimartini]|uniref:Spore germination protein AA n=1 Tax=Alkalicoccobacillus murimartini TaxID=171685 RepID=A0ABT9YDZ9_9BACI|nr:spore germination protein [Alkalicoccobacillus murimartini]MDQ0206076.1 spore germination protein AA [Alkalicoccobacillus murimartini]